MSHQRPGTPDRPQRHKQPDSGDVLVVGPAWVGDMVMAQSLFRVLAQRDPVPAIDVIAPPWSMPLLRRMPEVRAAFSLDVAHGELALRRRWRLGRSLRDRGYGQGIVLPRSAKAAVPVLAAGIPRRTGFRGEFRYGLLNDVRILDRSRLYRTVDRFVSLGLPGGAALPDDFPRPALHVDPEAVRHTIDRLGLEPATGQAPVLALCPGAEFGPAKQWPETRFGELARACLAAGWRVWILGSPNDRPVGQRIAALAPGSTDLCGQTSLDEVVDVLAATSAAVSNDSGLMHLAAALGTPLVALYGSSDPQYTPPLSSLAQVLYRGLSCSPCFARECPLGHRNCLWGIEAAEVREALPPDPMPESRTGR